MQKLSTRQLKSAVDLFANGFVSDPAFSFCLRQSNAPLSIMQRFFEAYLQTCNGLQLYTFEEGLQGVLCFYRWDDPPEEFDCPIELESLSRYQMLDRYYTRDFAVLDIMAVAPDCRGRGLAGEMIRFFVDYCKANGLRPLTEIFDPTHVSLYQRHGFHIVYEQTVDGITTYVLEYDL